MNNKDFFFCYNRKVYNYLTKLKNIEYITIAKNPSTDNIFTLFMKSDELQKALDEYNKMQYS
ncbi:hypothetical protein [Bacillus massiliigorillae]|uniref:hypothetical protein n=1 Tax=Bacillus massiliigorillae TaxID=1243664 RepID=UPI0005A63557|nr:hypothetical protein [Bacillus massiliigorillae]